MIGRKDELARLQSDVYRDSYHKILRKIIVSVFIILCLVLAILYFIIFATYPKFYGTATQVKLFYGSAAKSRGDGWWQADYPTMKINGMLIITIILCIFGGSCFIILSLLVLICYQIKIGHFHNLRHCPQRAAKSLVASEEPNLLPNTDTMGK